MCGGRWSLCDIKCGRWSLCGIKCVVVGDRSLCDIMCGGRWSLCDIKCVVVGGLFVILNVWW